MKVVRDPIHEYIEFSEEERRLIDSPWFQRLRHCAQNGPTRLVYPSTLGTRFEHSLGVMDVASRIFGSVLDPTKYGTGSSVVTGFIQMCKRDLRLVLGRDTASDQTAVADMRHILRVAALCHDLGHFPLSHTLERAFQEEFYVHAIPKLVPMRACHEVISAEVVRWIIERKDSALEEWLGRAVILTLLGPSAAEVKDGERSLRFAESAFYTLNAIIMGEYDADRLDYLQRDGYLSGSGFGRFDVERFIDTLMLVKKGGGYQVLPSSHALSVVEAALIERYKLYKWVYFHHKTLFFDEVCREVGARAFRRQDTMKSMFILYEPSLTSEEAYMKTVLGSLCSPASNIPPLVLFYGPHIGLTEGHYKLNPDFFINNADTHFFDDIWFCLQCRRKTKGNRKALLVIDSLVERKACGMTLWKDWSAFKVFFARCVQEAQASKDLSKAVAGESIEVHGSQFLDNLWKRMRDGSFPDKVRRAIVARTNAQLRRRNFGGLRAFMRIADWRLFGNLGEREIVGRTGQPDLLVKHSLLLGKLSGLEGEIPFYLFLVGKPEDVDAVRRDDKTRDEVLTMAAQAFILAIVGCFETLEVKGAWEDARKK
jgi:HD superfamily phosphohydrolase